MNSTLPIFFFAAIYNTLITSLFMVKRVVRVPGNMTTHGTIPSKRKETGQKNIFQIKKHLQQCKKKSLKMKVRNSIKQYKRKKMVKIEVKTEGIIEEIQHPTNRISRKIIYRKINGRMR